MKLIFSFLLISLISPAGFAQEDMDYLSLAQLLVRDGAYARAGKTLDKIQLKDAEDKGLFLSLKGMIALHNKQYKKSIDLFQSALQEGLGETEVYLYLAESHLHLKQFDKAEQALNKLSVEYQKRLPFYLIKAEIHWQQEKKHQAFKVLDDAKKLGLSKNVILKKKFYYFLEDQLYLSATELAFQLMEKPDNFNDVLAMASQLRVKAQHESSLKLLQALQLMRPGHDLVALELAQIYLAKNEKFSAALILEEAAKHNISLSYEASEMLRQVGKSYRARFLNLSTMDSSQRLKQKLALYLEEDDYFSLKVMIPQLNKHQLMEDEEIRYAVAYSLFRTGDFKRSKAFLDSIEKDGLFEKSIELKKEIQQCQADRWTCSETI